MLQFPQKQEAGFSRGDKGVTFDQEPEAEVRGRFRTWFYWSFHGQGKAGQNNQFRIG